MAHGTSPTERGALMSPTEVEAVFVAEDPVRVAAGPSEPSTLSQFQWFVAAGCVASHLYFLAATIWMGLRPDSPLRKDSVVVDQVGKFNQSKAVITLLTAPIVMYETAKHWHQGTYFPMTASDSAYALRFGKQVDRSPPQIRVGTVLSMIFLSFFLYSLSVINMQEINLVYCPLRRNNGEHCAQAYHALEWWGKLQIQVQFWTSILSIILRLKSAIYASIFLYVLVSALAISSLLTLGAALAVCLVAAVRCWGIDRETKVSCLPCWPLYDFVAFFYRKI